MRILLAESGRFSQRALSLMSSRHEVTVGDFDRSKLLEALKDIEILWVRLNFHVDREMLDAAPHLKVVVSSTTGLNHIDLGEMHRRGIFILSLKGEAQFLKDVRATAEHTLGLLLALIRHIPDAVKHVVRGEWERDLFQGEELFGKTIGIVGYGRLGRIVARYAQALDMKVLASDPAISAGGVDPGVELLTLPDLLASSDVVSLHASLDEKSRGFFGGEEFSLMKPRSWFINTARGELIDEAALLAALSSGKLAGAALDVLSDELGNAFDRNPLVAYSRIHPNLIITPHIGGCTIESFERTEVFLAEKLMHFIEEASESGA
jgi:D-3-phosphoglycerate dehydrogenase / 2-oxoglutarate reductase